MLYICVGQRSGSFLSIKQKMDSGSVNPLEWSNISLETWLEWHARMRNTLDVIALNKNFNYYIGAGISHAGLIDVFRPGYFYEEDSAQGVFLTDWVRRLNTDDKKYELKNLVCSGDCGAPVAPQSKDNKISQKLTAVAGKALNYIRILSEYFGWGAGVSAGLQVLHPLGALYFLHATNCFALIRLKCLL